MILTDVHTHSTYSSDGISPLESMVKAAEAMGVEYYGVSEHFDYDYNAIGLKIKGRPAFTDADGYFKEGRALQGRVGMRLLLGCELGYTDDEKAQEQYARVIEIYKPDFVVNSVHTCDGNDCWFPEYFVGKDKHEAYSRYLRRVLQSLSVPYRYDIVAHLGYVSRNAPYADPKLRYSEYAELYDEILKGIISRGKILEVNTSSRSAGSEFLPDTDVLERYFKLGGRKVSYASDCHAVNRICDKRDVAVRALRDIGFGYITVPCKGEEIQVSL